MGYDAPSEVVVHDDVVIGAGIAGLTAAYALAGAGREVLLVEATDRAGGLVRTVRRDGAVLEKGPETLQTTPEVVDLVERLGLVDRVVGPSAASADRFVLTPSGLVPLPRSLAAAWTTPLWRRRDLARALVEPFVPRRAFGPETVWDFAARRFGPAMADAVVDPFVAGVYAGDPHALEVDSAFADLVELERARGSVVRGGIAKARAAAPKPSWVPKALLSFRGGLQTLVDALVEALGDRLLLDSPALGLRRDGAGWVVALPAGDVEARRVWLACPLTASARLLDDAELSVPHAPVAAVHLGFRREDVAAHPPGFGWLAPSAVRDDALGCIHVSTLFPGHAPGRVMLRLMIGGSRAPHLALLPEAELVAHAQQVVREVLGIDAVPDLTDVSVATPGIPQVPLGHAEAVARWQRRWPGVRLLGWETTGVGASHGIRAGLAAERLSASA